MKKFILSLTVILTLLGLLSCGSGGGGGTNVNHTVYYTHRELAKEFVRRLNLDLGHDVDLVKVNTRQYDYIVVYDDDTGSYDAYWLGDYHVGENLADYLYYNKDEFYFDLKYIDDDYGDDYGEGYGEDYGEEFYKDSRTGLVFEDTHTVSRSSSGMQEYLHNVFKQAKAQVIVDKYGLSHERAGELVTLAMNHNALSKKGALTEDEYDVFARAAVGSSATELIRIMKDNDTLAGLSALKRAADKNGIGIEHAQTLLTQEFGLEL